MTISFFYAITTHQPLHSFPTRRSSDLIFRQRPRARRHASENHRARGRVSHRRDVGCSGALEDEHARSEEHTSELQSLTKIVCRLLLEKKKKNTQTVTVKTEFS